MQMKNTECGMIIVEASIVFPVMFLVIFVMLFTGNAYLQKCRIEAIASEMAIVGASYCADPMLDDIEDGDVPSLDEVDVRPYRYLVGGMSDIVAEIEEEFEEEISDLDTGLFSGMIPTDVDISVDFDSMFIYSTFSVEVSCKVTIPVRLLGMSDFFALNISSRVDMPVSSSSEFIRNVDLVEDYMEKYGVTEKIDNAKEKLTEMLDKAKNWFSGNYGD